MQPFVLSRLNRRLPGALIIPLVLASSAGLRAQITAPNPSAQTSIAVGANPYAIGVNVVTNKIYVVNQGTGVANGSVSVISGATNSAPPSPIPVGKLPYAIAVNPSTNRIYVANEASGTVTVIRGDTDAVVATVTVGNNPFAIVANAATNKIYAINNGSAPGASPVQGSVSIIDGSSNTVTNTILVGSSPVGAVVDPVSNKVFVANLGNPGNPSANGGNLTVIDGSGVATPISVGSCQNPRAVAVNPISSKVYVACITNNIAVVIDGSGASGYPVIKTLTSGALGNGTNPREVQVNPVTDKIYIAFQGNGTAASIAAVVDGTADTVVSTPSIGVSPRAVVVNPLTNQIYVGNQGGNSVSLIDGATNQSNIKFTVGTTPFAVAVNPITNLIYVANNGSNSVSVINGDKNLTAPVTTGPTPTKGVIDVADNQIFIINSGDSSVTAIDGVSNGTTSIPIASGPVAIAFNPVTEIAYVASTSGAISVIPSSFAPTMLTVSGTPSAITVEPATNQVYVANSTGNVTDIDVATGVMTSIPITGNLNYLLANSATNTIYASNQNGTVAVISGLSKTVTGTLGVGANGGPMALNPATNTVYVANLGSAYLSVINGTTVTTIPLISNPVALDINTTANKIYVATSGGTVAVINMTSNTVTKTINVGGSPGGIAVDQFSNRVYVSGTTFTTYSGTVINNAVSVIDGATDTVVNGVASGAGALLVNPVSDAVYAVNGGGLTAINVDGHAVIPLIPAVQGIPDSMTFSVPGARVFQTSNTTPQFSATVASTYTSTNVYKQPFTPSTTPLTNPPPTSVYYVVDGGPLAAAANSGPGTFIIDLSSQPQALGLHTLYVYPAYGNEGGHSSNGNALGNSPEIGNLYATQFLVQQPPTVTTVVGTPNPTTPTTSITFTATVTVTQGTNPNATGTVTFYDGTTQIGSAATITGSGSIYTATITTTLPVGTHTIGAVYSGDPNYPGSSGVTTESVINGVPAHLTIVASGAGTQTQVYGQQFASPLAVLVTDSTSTPVQGVAVTYTITPIGSAPANGISLAPLPAGTSLTGIASVLAAAGGVGVYTVTASLPASYGVADTVVFTLTVTPVVLTVTADSLTRPYGQPNPPFTSTISGFVNGDTPAVVTGTATYTTNATTTSTPGGSYNITPVTTSMSAANYTFTAVAGVLTITKATPGVDGTLPVTVTSSLNPSTYGQSVTFTATVPFDATGTIIFRDTTSGLNLGTATISGGQAFITTSSLPVNGSYQIEAEYVPGADPNYNAATSAPLMQVVNPALITVTANNQVRVYGQPNPALTYNYSPFANGDGPGVVTGVPAIATTAILTSSPSTYPISVSVAGLSAANYIFVGAAGILTVTKATPGQNGTAAIVVTSSLNPSTYGQSVTLTATVPSDATGSVTFFDGSIPIGTGTISGGVATLATGSLPTGSDPITAQYGGDSNYNGATSAILNQVVNKAVLTVKADNLSRLYAQPNPTLTATITGFTNGDTLSVVSGAASLTTTATILSPMGSYPIIAGIGTLFATNYTFTFANGTLTISPLPSSLVFLSIAPSTVMYGNPAVMTAVVTPSFATGTVSFFSGSTYLGSATVDNTGTAVLPISSLNVGTYTITARYNGDQNVPASSSNTATLTVIQRTGPAGIPALTVLVANVTRTASAANPPFSYSVAGQLVNGDTYAMAISGTPSYSTTAGSTPGSFPINLTGLSSLNYLIGVIPGTLTVTPNASGLTTTIALAANPASSNYGAPVTLTATVTPGSVTGTVSFFDGSTYLGQSAIAGGVATLVTSTLNAGSHTITAQYNGDGTYSSSVSAPANVTVAKVPLTITVQNANVTFGAAAPQFAYVATGTLYNGDTYPTVITGTPVYTGFTAGGSAGTTYSVSVSGLSAQNYSLTLVPATVGIVISPSTTTLATSATSATYGTLITLTATVAPSAATGIVIFTEGSVVLGKGTLSSGVASLPTSSLSAGTHTITATYLGDGNYGASTSTPVVITITQQPLTVTVSNATRPVGEANPAFTYTISGTLYNGDTYANAVQGVAIYSTTAIVSSPASSYPISIVGGLNSTNYALTFVSGALTVSLSPAATVTLTSSLNPSTYSALVTFTAIVPIDAIGNISFHEGATQLGLGTIVNGVATLSISTLAVGTHNIVANFGGDSKYGPAASSVLAQVVNKATPGQNGIAAITVASSLNPSVYTNSVTFTATVPTGATGAITFLDGTTVLGTGTVSGGTATLTTSTLQTATHPITAQYSGDSNFNGATSTVLSQVVKPLPGAVTESVPSPTLPAGQSVVITATVPAGETGTITFFDGTTPLGTVTISGTTVTITIPSFTPGTHTIIANYSGDTNHTTASATISLNVTLPVDFAIADLTQPQLIPPGASATFTIQLTSVNGIFTSPVTLSATNLPANATYTYTPPAVTPGANGATSAFVVSVPPQAARLERGSKGPLALAVLLLPIAFLKRYRHKPQRLLFWILIAFTSFTAMTGCGVGGYFSQIQQTYTIIVTGTSGSLSHSTTATLTIE